MIRRLSIEHYGLIGHAAIAFADGSTIFTGETGSGKTMVLGALGFVLGERAGADVVQRGSARAIVTLEFEASPALREQLRQTGFELDQDEDAVLLREMSAGGKSVIRLNGRPATAGYVRELASAVLDMIGQHEAQRLLSPSYHVELLDRFAGSPALAARTSVAQIYVQLQVLHERLRTLSQDAHRAQEQLEVARISLGEIESSAPQIGEDERLRERRRYLDNSEKITFALRTAHDALAGDEHSASDALGNAAASLQPVFEIGGELCEIAGCAAALQSEVNELAVRISRELDASEFDPAELEAITGRLDTLDRLKRKYGDSLEKVLVAAKTFRATVDDFSNRDERIAQLQGEIDAATLQLKEAAKDLSDLRRKAAKRLQSRMKAELGELALPSARFEASLRDLDAIGPDGAEQIEFVFAANIGQPERPLVKVASGGELSRVLLALVVVLAAAREPATLVFDEIDAGIGGATAAAVGQRLEKLATETQLLCVTHLAQIASGADRHYVLEKRETGDVTSIEVFELDGKVARTAELARMLSGQTHEAALRHATTLLDRSLTPP